MPDLAGNYRVVNQALRFVVGLTGEPPPQDVVLDPDVTLQLVVHASIEGALGFLVDAVRNGRIKLGGVGEEMVARYHRQAMFTAIGADAAVLMVLDLFAERGIRAIVLKGVALANDVYRDPSVRCYADGDLLVEPGMVSAAVATLVEAGGRRVDPELRPGFDDRFAKDIELAFRGASIDLHRTLVEGWFAMRLPTARLFDLARHVFIAERAVPVPSIADSYLHAAVTAGIGDVPPRLTTLRDLIEMERHPEFTVASVLHRATELGLEMPLALSCKVRKDQAPERPSPFDEWARRRKWTDAERMLAWAYTNPSRTYWRRLIAVPAVVGWRNRIAYLQAIASPSMEFARARGETRTSFAAGSLRRLIFVDRKHPT